VDVDVDVDGVKLLAERGRERGGERLLGETGHVIVKFILSRLSFPGKIVVFYVEGKVSNTSDQTFSAQ
jgi:hypothetical protein